MMRLQLNALFALLCLVAGVAVAQEIEPLPLKVHVDPNKAALGKRLFNDKRLSADNSIACASCHDLGEWGAEPKSISTGIRDQLGTRNSPTVFNSGFNFKQFWDGRADSLSHQATMPVVNPVEMGMATWQQAVDKVAADASYQEQFGRLYEGIISKHTITDAMEAFQQTLVTANAPFDQYLRGNAGAISAEQKRGFELFKSYGCVACHQGKNVGGNMFQKFGVLKDISLGTQNLSDDLGRYNVTRNEWDKRVFKVPSLRLAVKTPPYFHNGSIATIEEAVDIMIKYQLGREVPQADRDSIIAFLGSLVGTKPAGVK